MLANAVLIITMLACGLFGYRRSLRYLRYFQQEEYDAQRFAAWFLRLRAFDRRGTLITIAVLALLLLLPGFGAWVALAAALALGAVALSEENPLRSGKKSLKLTSRARRIWYLALALMVLAELAAAAGAMAGGGLVLFWALQLLIFQACPFLLSAANALLTPYESRVQQRFIDEAQARLKQVAPLTIGITGSYGKTSTKRLLAQLLNQSLGLTFATPGSINTVMGITRQLREQLKPGTKFAVIEMAAYRRGSIARLCRLTPPDVGLITNIGVMHLERFGSAENVLLAKSELAQAVPDGGLLVLNGDNSGCRRIAQLYPSRRILLYGLDGAADLACQASAIGMSAEGTQFTLTWQGRSFPALTPLLGRPALSNVLGAFTMACALGAEPEYLVALLRTLETEPNRLQVTRDALGLWLNDAYSSNPAGLMAALEVLAALPARQRIMVTPGMIELGEQQVAENSRCAEAAARTCDLVVVVGTTNRAAWLQGFARAGAAADRYHLAATRDAAFGYLAERRQAGDVVLIENDLPDLYEARPQF